MQRIGIISDTHGLIRPEVMNALSDCDCIVHAGDINQPEVLDTLRTLAPVYAVRGNADKGIWAESLPESRSPRQFAVQIVRIGTIPGSFRSGLFFRPDNFIKSAIRL